MPVMELPRMMRPRMKLWPMTSADAPFAPARERLSAIGGVAIGVDAPLSVTAAYFSDFAVDQARTKSRPFHASAGAALVASAATVTGAVTKPPRRICATRSTDPAVTHAA
jgi:hypothetical protein